MRPTVPRALSDAAVLSCLVSNAVARSGGQITASSVGKDELAALRREVSELKDAINKPAPAPIDWERRVAEHQNQAHQMREGRMALASNFHPDDLRAMEAAAPTHIVKGIALRDARAPTGPSSQGAIPSSQQVSNVRGGGGTSGWAREIPLGPQPGIDLIDRGVNAALPHGPEWGKGKKG